MRTGSLEFSSVGRRVGALTVFLLVLVWPLAARAELRSKPVGCAADGVTLDTMALQEAINAAHAAGGGVVRLGAGRYLTGTLELRSGVTLQLDRGAVLLGSPHVADYRRGKWPALLLARGQRNIAIVGEGEIDGQGKLVAADTVRIYDSGNFVEFFPGVKPDELVNMGADKVVGRIIDPHAMQRDGTLGSVVAPRSRADMATWRVDECVRPQLIEFTECTGVRVSGVTLRNAANWVQSYRWCEDVELAGVRVVSTSYWNNDGLDLVNSRRVRVMDCDIDAADDGICLKSEPDAQGRACEDIEIARCRVRSSANAVKFGTASHHDFRRVRIRDLEVRDTFRSAIAIETVDGGTIEDIEVRGVRARNTGNAFFLRLGHRNGARTPGALRRVLLEDFQVEVPATKPDAGYEHEGPLPAQRTSLLPASIAGLPGYPVEDVVLRDIVVTYGGAAANGTRGEVTPAQLDAVPENAAGYPEFSMFGELPAWGIFMRHVRGVKFENVQLALVAPDFRPAIVVDRAESLVVERLRIGAGGGEPAVVFADVERAKIGEAPVDGAPTSGNARVRRLSRSEAER